MDEFGTCEIIDIPDIAWTLKKYGSVTFAYSGDQKTAYVITITYVDPQSVLGVMPFGGSPAGRYMVAVLFRGAAFHFQFGVKLIHPNYVAEKLALGASDSEYVADFLNALREFMLIEKERGNSWRRWRCSLSFRDRQVCKRSRNKQHSVT